MKTTVGIFTSRSEAERAVEQLQAIGIAGQNIDVLSPGASDTEINSVPTTETEQPGMGKALGGVVGGALGAASGMSLGAAAASLFIPGVGPILATGIIGAALLGAGGAVGGAAAGATLEQEMADGLPKDELFVYEEALRRGRTVIIALTDDDEQDRRAREILQQAGAESLDSARENWWVGLRDDEEQAYAAEGGDFNADEPKYRMGFESALHPDLRGRSYTDSQDRLRDSYGEACGEECFRRGFERGQAYHTRLGQQHKSDE